MKVKNLHMSKEMTIFAEEMREKRFPKVGVTL